MSVAEANTLMGDFDLSAYFEAVGVDAQELIVRQPSYFEKFADIFKNTGLTVWQNYLKFHFVSNYPKDLVDLKFNFYSITLRGVEEQAPLWK